MTVFPTVAAQLVTLAFKRSTLSENTLLPALMGVFLGGLRGTETGVIKTRTAAGATVACAMDTPQISWASLRIVGFESNIRYPSYPTAIVGAMDLGFTGLRVGGGADLFVAEDYSPGSVFLMGQSSFAGLRDYPLLEAPNTAEVTVQAVGAAASDVLWFSCNLVCEILMDDNYGAHIPGPYARPGALVRQGGSFIS
jgi:hypothetical protein